MVFVYKCNIKLKLDHPSIYELREKAIMERLLAPKLNTQNIPSSEIDKWWYFSKNRILDPVILWYDYRTKNVKMHPGGTRCMGAAMTGQDSLKGLIICNRKAKGLEIDGIEIERKLFKKINRPFNMEYTYTLWNFYTEYLGISKVDEPWDSWKRMMSGVCNLGNKRVDLILAPDLKISLNTYGTELYKSYHINEFEKPSDAVKQMLADGDTIRDHLLQMYR